MAGKKPDNNGRGVTLGDVARLAGVAPMTVSRCLNQPETVRSETRLKVRRAIDQRRQSCWAFCTLPILACTHRVSGNLGKGCIVWMSKARLARLQALAGETTIEALAQREVTKSESTSRRRTRKLRISLSKFSDLDGRRKACCPTVNAARLDRGLVSPLC
ncbi:MAG: LacI family DNA-binding transcriptional regulator [Pseudomonas sp.]|uniref:LacI family DNA-binding transcriptional regulator n=1 Tax=Pseudomonas sp. TaxID=306 RepID=UPI003D6DBB7D